MLLFLLLLLLLPTKFWTLEASVPSSFVDWEGLDIAGGRRCWETCEESEEEKNKMSIGSVAAACRDDDRRVVEKKTMVKI